MPKALFLNGTAQGHINPTLPLASELTRQGEQVTYLSTELMKPAIEAAGCHFLDYGPGLAEFHQSYRPGGNHPFYSLMEYLLAQNEMLAGLALARTAGMTFDYVIHDAMLGGGHAVARTLKLPAVCTCTAFASLCLPVPDRMLQPGVHPQLDALYRRYCTSLQPEAIKTLLTEAFFQREELNIVFTSSLLQPGGDSFPDCFQFVGPAIGQRSDTDPALEEWMSGKQVLYISMGTINNNLVPFYQLCIEAFGNGNSAVVMAVGEKTDLSALGAIPANFRVLPRVPQLDVLKRAQAFISHCGLNSASEAMLFGVPVVALPIANDQPAVARQLQSLGAAIELDSNKITAQSLRCAVISVMQPSYAAACRLIGDSLRQAGGAAAGAQSILRYINK